MSAPAPNPSAADETDSLDGWERALLDRQLEALGRLADMGMAMAAAIERRATAEAPGSDADLHHAAMDFARVSRAVRMTFALQSRLIADFKDASRAAEAAAADDGPIEVRWGCPDIVEHDVVLKRQLRGVVQELAEAASMEREAVERLVLQAGERLEDDRLFHDITKRPMGETVALICKDLGIAPDWELLSDIHWARQEIKEPPPGSPYAGWKDRQAPAQGGLHAPPPLVPSG
jgi:hypothetical protein